ncbi:carboxypeptidase-like regulatory domain-containing protein [Pedobacter jamesrossensis]|uniref:Carboxypeptidase-like regulatory domain-containing protein n=1 Tax=Pedobacter jamesrossensis TaxID=1908238 RepID=A0ABV8NIQ5_9SPHI
MKKIFLSLLAISLLVLNISAFGQSVISGYVKNSNGQILPYTNIGIKRGKIGTVSKEDGKFSISIPDSLSNDSLTFSSIGFRDKSYLIKSIANKKSIEAVLEEKINQLAEVTISNVKLKQYKLGITGRTPMVSIPTKSYQQNDILEQARLIRLKKPAKIMNANIFVLSESMKEVRIRLNFYAFENGLPGKRLIEKSIIKKAIIKNGWFTIDLKDEAIYLDEDFVVSFEYLPSEQKSIVFAAKLGAANSFLRSSSQGVWIKNELGGCSIYVTAEM